MGRIERSRWAGLSGHDPGGFSGHDGWNTQVGELPAQLDEIYQRGEAVFRSQDERPETGSRLRTLLTDLERWLGILRPVAKQTVTAIVLYATTYAARDALRQALKLA